MNIKDKIEEIVEKITDNKDLLSNFKDDPVKTVETVAGIDLPNDVVEKVVDAVKAKINFDKASDALDSLKKLF